MAARNLPLRFAPLLVLALVALVAVTAGAQKTAPAHNKGGGKCSAAAYANYDICLTNPGCTRCSSKQQSRCSACGPGYRLSKGVCVCTAGDAPVCDAPLTEDSTLVQEALAASDDWATFEPLEQQILACESSQCALEFSSSGECMARCTASGHTACMPLLAVPWPVGAKLYAACMSAWTARCLIECDVV